MRELEDYLKVIIQILEDEHSNYHGFLQKVKKRTEFLNYIIYGPFPRYEREPKEEEKRP
jgi:predicted AAA+ superfamily ATPase